MEITLEAIISFIGLFVGGGTIGGFLFWKQTKKRAIAEAKLAEAEAKMKEAEARKAEIEAAEEKLEYYQHIIDDVVKDRDYYKQDRDELREQINKIMRSVAEWKETSEAERSKMKMDINSLRSQMDCMRKLLCGRDGCPDRVPVNIFNLDSKKRKTKKESDVEPLDHNDL